MSGHEIQLAFSRFENVSNKSLRRIPGYTVDPVDELVSYFSYSVKVYSRVLRTGPVKSVSSFELSQVRELSHLYYSRLPYWSLVLYSSMRIQMHI